MDSNLKQVAVRVEVSHTMVLYLVKLQAVGLQLNLRRDSPKVVS